jgi:opacity protein-like surface antigen
MRNKLIVVLMFVISAPLGRAQVSGNAFLGYSFADEGSSTGGIVNGNRIALNGWNASIEIKPTRWVGVVADFSGHYGSGKQSFTEPTVFFLYDAHEHEFLFGPRVSATFGRIHPFGEALLGVGLVSLTNGGVALNGSNNSFAAAFGGGVDYKIAKLIGLRVQGDYIRTDFFSIAQNNFRLSTGVILRF